MTDSFAQRFVGPRPPGPAAVDGRVTFRTACVDRLIRSGIAAHRIDTVLHLGAGFDTRPQRLDLPATLRWIEVDSEAVLAEKTVVLAGEPASCRVERIAADLADPADRGWLGLIRGTRTLVVTEGVLVYLTPPEVEALARDLHAAGVIAWITDVTSPLFVASYRRAASGSDSLGRLLRFAPADPTGFFAACRFRCDGFESVERLMERAGRGRPFAGAPAALRELLLDASGVLVLSNSGLNSGLNDEKEDNRHEERISQDRA